MKPNIFIVGPSGTGKSSSLRNCDPETTAILNSEQKALPFRGAGKFKLNVAIPNMKEYWGTTAEPGIFLRAIQAPHAKLIINESFTSLVEHICVKIGHVQGHDYWRYYKEEVMRVLIGSKNPDKYIAFTGIDMVLEGSNGIEERAIAIQGSMKKLVEKEFVIVLYSTVIENAQGIVEYKFITNKQKGYENVPAKSPMGMLPPIMDNDLAEVIKLAEAYYNDPEPTEEKKSYKLNNE